MAIEHEEIDLSLVVDSIKRASDRELRVLSEISAKLDAKPNLGSVESNEKPVIEGSKKESSIPNNKARRRRKTNAKLRRGEVAAQPVKRDQSDSLIQAEEGKASSIEQALSNPSAIADNLPQAQKEEAKVEQKAPVVVVTPPASQNDRKNASESQPVSVNVDQADIDTSDLKKAITDGFSEFEDFWKDEKGRLRRGNGTYASKEENARYQKTAAEIAKDRESEKQSTILTKVIGTFRTAADVGHEVANNDATDAAGAAAGGSWFYAAKELYNVGENVIGGIDTAVDKAGEIKEQWKSNESFSFGRFFGKDKATEEAFVSANESKSSNNRSESVTQESDVSKSEVIQQNDSAASAKDLLVNKDTSSQSVSSVGATSQAVESNTSKERANVSSSERDKQSNSQAETLTQDRSKTTGVNNQSQSVPGRKELTSSKEVATREVNSHSEVGSVIAGQKDVVSSVKDLAESQAQQSSASSSDSVLTDRRGSLSIAQPTGFTQSFSDGMASMATSATQTKVESSQSSAGGESLLSITKQQSLQANNKEILQEQSEEQKQSNAEIIALLDEISSNTKGKDNGLLSELAGLGSLFGGGGGRAGRGRRGRGRGGLFGGSERSRGRAGRSVSIGKPEKPSRLKSVLSATGKAGAGVAAGGVSMAGKAFKGISTLAKGAGKAVPFLAPILAAYDAYSGFTDKEAQQKTFDLKEGEEATTGQKAAMAAGSVLDMGGLVSGAAGLVGDALGALGFEGAKEAMTFEASDIAKGIYDLFVSKSSSESEGETKAVNVSQSQSSDSYQDEVDRLVGRGMSLATAKKVAKQKEKNREMKARAQESKEGALTSVSSDSDSSRSQQSSEPASNSHSERVDARLEKIRETKERYQGAQQRQVDGMPVAKVASVGDSVVTTSSASSTATSDASKVESMQSTSGVTKLQTNRSVSSIQAERNQVELNKSKEPNVIQLDKKSVDDLAKGIKKANTEATTIIESDGRPSNGPGASKPVSNNPGVGSIPNNFTDRSLQRQSADLE